MILTAPSSNLSTTNCFIPAHISFPEPCCMPRRYPDPDREGHQNHVAAGREPHPARNVRNGDGARLRDRVRPRGCHRPRPAAARPQMKVAVGRCPQTGAPRQSTISRLENAPSKTEAAGGAHRRSCRSGRRNNKAAHAGDPRHRRHILRGAWRSATCVLERPSRRARLRVDAHLARTVIGKGVLLLEVTARNPGWGSAGGNGLEGRGEGVASSFWKTHPRASLARGGGRANSDSTDRSLNHGSPRNRASSAPVDSLSR
jgi:hypothetical protein